MFITDQIHRLLSLASPYPSRVRARRVYFTAQDSACEVFGLLAGADGRTAGGRAQVLLDLARLEHRMAAVTAAGWPGPDGEDDAASMQASARLLEIVASTELAEGQSHRLIGPDDWEDRFGDVFDRLDGEPDLKTRVVYLTSLYLAAHPIVGDQAAETIAVVRNAYADIAVDTALETTNTRSAVAFPGRQAQGESI